MSKLLHSRASYCAAGPSRSQAHGRPWFLIPIPQILSPKEPSFLLTANWGLLLPFNSEGKAGCGAGGADGWVLLADFYCQRIYCGKTVQQSIGYAAGYVFQKGGADLHLLFYYLGYFRVVDCPVQIVVEYGIGGIGPDADFNRVPGTHNGLLRFCTMVGVEPQAVKCYCLFFNFHFIRNVMNRSSCR